MYWEEAIQARKMVLRGRLSEHPTANVLLALSLSRQFTMVELEAIGGGPAGRVFLKAGMVVAVEVMGSDLSGIAAFQRLLSQPLASYSVYRLPDVAEYPAPLGRLSSQLLVDVGITPSTESIPAQRTGRQSVTGARAAAASVQPAPAPAAAAAPAPSPRPMASAPAPRPAAPAPRPAAPAPAPAPVPRPAAPAPAPAPYEPPARSPTSREATLMGSPSMNRSVASIPTPSLQTGATSVIAIASPKGGCGKTTIALNLAIGLARAGLRVVLVDTDPNGDVLSALGARGRAESGAYDVVSGHIDLASAVRRTVLDKLRLLPAMGERTPLDVIASPPEPSRWRRVFHELAADADLIIADTPAGMFGLSHSVLAAVEGVIGVLQAEAIPHRSFSTFSRAIEAMPNRPKVVGVVLNMVNASDPVSVEVVQSARADLPAEWVLRTELPRDTAFNAAASEGLPLGMDAGSPAPAITDLFESLAAEIKQRTGATPPAQAKPKPSGFLL